MPAIGAVFDDDEVSALEVTCSEEAGGSIALLLTAKGEAFRDLVVQAIAPDTTAEEWCERLRSNLLDFVAESRFGWGQNRDVRA